MGDRVLLCGSGGKVMWDRVRPISWEILEVDRISRLYITAIEDCTEFRLGRFDMLK